MKFFRSLVLFASFLPAICLAQPTADRHKGFQLERPKLVVGIVVDQMRWDYIYRYFNRYGEGGFKRFLSQGFSCENTFINYLPSYTAVGHTTIFTGSIPALHGIAGNGWVEQLTGKSVYCTDDSTVQGVGSQSAAGKMSPRNLLTSTITDELKLATNFRSKVIGVSLKDRASILPAGHLGAAYWFDDTNGSFITSTYYANELPKWVSDFNSKKRAEALVANGWNTLYPINTYLQSDSDNKTWEGSYRGESAPVFPHDIKKLYADNKGIIRSTPFGNTLTLEFAKAALAANDMGKDSITDFLTINCASTDYVGHQFGPNAIEVEDVYLRLDKDLESFFKTLDSTVGKGQWTVFLSADHGAAHAIGFMQEHKMPSGFWYEKPLADTLNKILQVKYGNAGLVRGIENYQVNFDLDKIDAMNADFDDIKKTTVNFLQRQPAISFAVDIANIGAAPVPESLKKMIVNGYNFKRSGSVQIVLDAGWFETYSKTGTTHGTWNPYDTHIPLLWYGWGIKQGHSNQEVYMTDIAATLAALLHIQMPNGCVGKPIEAVMK